MVPDTGIILAGGKSRRMGKDKLFLKIGDETFIEKQYRVLKGIFQTVNISVHKKRENIPYPQIEDIVDAGSLGGIYSSLLFLKKPIFVVAADMPFISEQAVKKFISLYSEDYDVIITENKRMLEPLFAIYSPSCIKYIEELISKEDFRIINFFDKVKIKIIPQKRFEKIDKKMLFLKNINEPETYEKILKGEIN